MTTHDYSHPVNTTPPKVCAVVVHHRTLDHQYTVACLDSLKAQSYANLECITIDNLNGQLTIAEARNQAVAHTDAELVLFVAEEDMLTLDTVQAMVDLYLATKAKEATSLVHITTPCTVLLPNGTTAIMPHMTAPGMYERAYLVAHPFDASLDYHVDAAQQRAMCDRAKREGKDFTISTTHHYGYVHRAHPFRRDGITVNQGRA